MTRHGWRSARGASRLAGAADPVLQRARWRSAAMGRAELVCDQRRSAVAGVALTYADGLRFAPPRATLREALAFLPAGPGPSLRGAYVDFVMKRAHPRDAHVLLWYLAARPDIQRQGVGRALLDRVRAGAQRSGLPIYLDTTKFENVDYYRSHGYSKIGEARLLRGARVWFMYHDGRPGPGRRRSHDRTRSMRCPLTSWPITADPEPVVTDGPPPGSRLPRIVRTVMFAARPVAS